MRNRLKKQILIYSISFLIPLAIPLIDASYAQADGSVGKSKKIKQADPTLTLESAIDEALEHNALLEAAGHEVVAKEARIKPSGALPDPSIEGRFTNYPINSFSPRDSGMTGNEVMLVQKFPFPGKREKLTEIAKNEFEASKEDARQTNLNLIQKVKTSYYDLFLAFEREKLLQEQSKILRALQSIAQSKYSIGTASQSEVFELQLKAASILVKIEEERKRIEATRAELNHLLGREEHLSVWKPQAITTTNINLQTVIDLCASEERLKDNPSIQSLHSLANAARSKVAYSDLNVYPDFEVGVGYMQRFSNRDDNGEDFVSARISIPLPVWRRDKQDEEQREAKAEQGKRDALLREGKIELSHALHETVAALTEAINKLALYRKAIFPLSDASIESAQKSYETNQTSYLTVLNLLNDRFEAKMDYFAALAQHESAIATLEALIGAPLANFTMSGKTIK